MAGTTFTGKGVLVYRLTVAKHAVMLEARGIRMSRGRKWTAVMRKEFGLKARAPHAEVVAAIQKKLDELVPEAQAEGGIQAYGEEA